MGRFLIGCALALAIATGANAQTYPARTVTLIVPFAAGGPADITGRITAEQLSRRLGQQFIVENVVGAGGTTGVTRGARAAPDGYTLVLGHMGTHAAAVVQYPNLAYKPETDFEPIGLVAEYPVVLVTRKDFPANTLREFAAYAKENEAKINMAHAGVGSVSHTGCLLLNAAAGFKPTLVPFTGTAPAMNAIIAGQVDYVCDPISGPLGHIRAGTVKGLAIASAKRHPALPDLPTAPKADCRHSRPRHSMACSRRKARRSTCSTGWSTRSMSGSTTRAYASASPISAPMSLRRSGAARGRSPRW